MKKWFREDPEELSKRFFELSTRLDLANLLGITEQQLIYHVYIDRRRQRQYINFTIPKKSGGVRTISAPQTSLKIIQEKLNEILETVYKPKACVHGFVTHRSILTNAQMHVKQRYILNLDLNNFFPSINLGRVRGMFIAYPYNCNSTIATLLAQICCYNNELPQGAPTSPIISNMICSRMDSQLLQLAKEQRSIYTRYADDLTFSTSLKKFPHLLATVNSSILGEYVEIGEGIKNIIKNNGFEINPEKTRLSPPSQRQEVTGLTVNDLPNMDRSYVNQIRAMLHAWEKYGLEAAEKEFVEKYDKQYRGPYKPTPHFREILKGKIDFLGMVRGKEDRTYLKFYHKLHELDPSIKAPVSPSRKAGTSSPIFFCHSNKDDDFATRLSDDINSHGYDTWLDHENISSATTWDSEVAQALDVCKILLFIITESSLVSKECENEWAWVIGKKDIIPIYQEKNAQKTFENSSRFYRVSRRQGIKFYEDYNQGLEKLIKDLLNKYSS